MLYAQEAPITTQEQLLHDKDIPNTTILSKDDSDKLMKFFLDTGAPALPTFDHFVVSEKEDKVLCAVIDKDGNILAAAIVTKETYNNVLGTRV